MTFLQLIGIIGAFTVFVLISWWCINNDCSNDAQWKRAMEKMTEEKFPYMWKETRPTVDKYVMQKLIESEQEIKELKQELNKLRGATMTQEDRQLLIQDLCARVPYHPKGRVVNSCNGAECDEWLTCATFTMFTNIMNNARLYLRPMSSMTEEEKEELRVKNIIIGVSTSGTIETTIQGVDWLNKKMFDYRGLIPKGLAISTEEFNPYKD